MPRGEDVPRVDAPRQDARLQGAHVSEVRGVLGATSFVVSPRVVPRVREHFGDWGRVRGAVRADQTAVSRVGIHRYGGGVPALFSLEIPGFVVMLCCVGCQ